jgi:alpha-ribazole phosphatase
MIQIARHAPVDAAGLCYGRSDVRPSIAPEIAADDLDVGAHGDRIWSSPSPRCLRLAEEIAARRKLPLVVDDRLQELDFGRWEGRTWTAIEREDGAAYQRWMEHWKVEAPPGGESIADLEARIAAWLAARNGLRRHRARDGDLVIAHAGVVRALWVACEGLDWDQAFARPVPHLSWISIPT